jgi:hypothetical protein
MRDILTKFSEDISSRNTEGRINDHVILIIEVELAALQLAFLVTAASEDARSS